MIIARYLTKEMAQTLAGVTFVLMLIFLSNQLVRYLKYAANGKIASSILMQLMGYEIPFLLALILPLGLYLGIIFTYSRMYADNELRVCQASGLSTAKLVKITAAFGLFITLIVMILMLWVNPYFAAQKNKLVSKGIATENILDTIIPGRFQVTPDDKRVLYVENISRNRQEAQNIFIAEQKVSAKNPMPTWSVLSAGRGFQIRDPKTKHRYVVASDGFRYEGVPGENAYKIIQFEKYAVRLLDQSLGLEHPPEETQSTAFLLRNYAHHPKIAAELQWRLSLPIASLLLMLLAIPLSAVHPRQSRYVYLFPAVLVYVIYMNLLFLTRDWLAHGSLSSSIGMWWVHGLLGILVATLFIVEANIIQGKKAHSEGDDMRILQRYIAKAVISATILVLVVVTALNFIIGMLRELRNIGEGDYGFMQIILHEVLLLPHEVYQFFPMLVLLGGVIGLGTLSNSHELMVMRTAGVSIKKIMLAVANTALILILFATLVGELGAPRTNYLAEKYKSLAETMGQAVVTLSGIWIHEGTNFIHIDSVVGKHRLQGVTRYEFDSQHQLLASYYSPELDFEMGHWISKTGVKTILVRDGTRVVKYKNAKWDIQLTPNLLNVGLVEAQSMSLQKLAEYSKYLTQNKLQAGVFQLEFWQRIFQPLTTLVMTLLAIPFVFAAPRSSSMGRRILLAIIIGFVFYILNAFFGQFSIVFQFHPIMAALLPSLLFALVGFIWMTRSRFS